MSPATPDVKSFDLPGWMFPFVMEIFDEVTGELVYTAQIDGPSMVPIPGKEPEDNPRMIAMTYPGYTTLCFADGEVRTYPMEES